MRAPTVYVITHHNFNHAQSQQKSIDPRFLSTEVNFTFYVVDKQIPDKLKSKPHVLESSFDPAIAQAGAKYLAEWSLLLAEEKHAFCSYPFFMVSSRFYQKNAWLRSLNIEWDFLFHYLETYKWGVLPSYDRPLRWVDMKKSLLRKRIFDKHTFFPFSEKCLALIRSLYQVELGKSYRFIPDFFCNYIGFNSREDLLSYVQFYHPLIEFFLDANLQPKTAIEEYILPTGSRNDKPLAYLLELLSHLYFFKTKADYFALHYNGYYEIRPSKKEFLLLKSFSVSAVERIQRYASWQRRKLTSETESLTGIAFTTIKNAIAKLRA